MVAMFYIADIFERVYCINLDRRPDRWETFRKNLPDPWPFRKPERFPAFDGEKCPPPDWWKQGKGAWGCFRSHLAIIERCLNDGVNSVLIFEDDAAFDSDFAEKAVLYLASIPDLKGMVYFGGQHLRAERHPPIRLNEHVYLAYNLNRAHAYGVVGREALQAVYRHLCRNDWNPAHHIDHHYGRLHESGEIYVYSPARWMVGQGPGKSNICGWEFDDTRFWRSAEELEAQYRPRLAAVVAVVGPFRSGTSCVAGMLHSLGVSMGAMFPSPTPFAPKGTFEAIMLGNLCRRFFKEPGMVEMVPSPLRIAYLRRWLEDRTAGTRQGIIGAKHPSFCLMLEDLEAAWPDLKLVVVDRDPEAIIRSGLAVGWLPTAREVIPKMLEVRERSLESVKAPVLRLRYEEVLADPQRAVDQLVAFCGVTVSDQAKAAAVGFVDANLNHYSKAEVAHAS